SAGRVLGAALPGVLRGVQRVVDVEARELGSRRAAEFGVDPLGGFQQLAQVHAGVDVHAVQHVDDGVGGDVAGGAVGIRAAAQAGNGGIDGGDAHVDAGKDVGQRLVARVMEVDREAFHGHASRARVDQDRKSGV